MIFSSVQLLTHVWLCNPMNRSMPGLPVHHQLLEFTKLMSIESVMPSSHLILCCPLLLLPPIPPSIRVFSNESTLHMRWPKYRSFSFSISPSSEHPGLISIRMDWLDLLADHGTLKSLLQHHSSKASILRCSAFFTVQLSHPYFFLPFTVWLLDYLKLHMRFVVVFHWSSLHETRQHLHRRMSWEGLPAPTTSLSLLPQAFISLPQYFKSNCFPLKGWGALVCHRISRLGGNL